MPISATNLNKAYLAYFGRPADAAGQAYFATLEQADVIKAFDASAESQAIYGGDTAAKINAIYKNLFNREAEPAGLTYWLSLVSSGRVTPAGAAFSILEGAQGTDKTAIDNKLAASEAFIKAMDTTTEIVNYSGLNAAASARAFLATVDASAASLTAAVAGAQAAVTSAISTTQGNDYGVSLQLTRDRDSTDPTAKQTNQTTNIIASTSGNDFYSGTVDPANAFNNTVNNDDFIDGGKGVDTLTLALLGSNTSNARVKNVENLVLGTNVLATPAAPAITYDLNINAGGQQTTGYQTIAADRIIAGEVLTVANVFMGTADAALPKLIWDNASNTNAAGVVNYNYLSGQTTGNSDTQAIDLRSVNAGVLNIATGIETFAVNSGSGINPALNVPNTEANTLATTNNNANNPTAANAGANADLASGNTLTTVNVAGGAAFGARGTVITTGANIGLTDRNAQAAADNNANVAANDRGLTTGTTAANLVSLSNTVTTYNATNATGAQNVMFTGKASGVAPTAPLAFTGGSGDDYVEFQAGNTNANGGIGRDVFAFINVLNNSGFGESDTINGGEGADTIQIGLNGNVQTYNISETELRNKDSIGTIDLRGQTNFLTLSSDFVSKADTANSITVVTDRIIQTSDTVFLNPTGGANNGLENASSHTVNLSKLSANQTVVYSGGSGSDRIILNDANYNVLKTLVGGGNEGAAIAAGQNRYDTVTVVTNGENVVLDAEDLKNTSGFEGFVLTKNSAAATYNITLTRAFMNANTLAADDGNTGIIETNFQIGTSAAANNSILSGGDTVTIDVRDLLNATDNGRATGYTTRTFDVTSLENSGVAVTFIGNTGNLTLAQVRAAGIAVANGASANANDVVGLSPANPVGNVGRTLVFTATDGNTTTGWQITNNEVATANADTINVGALVLAAGAVVNGGAGVNTLVVRDGANLSGTANVSNVTNLTFDATGVAGTNDLTLTAAQHALFTGTVTAAGTGANGENIIGSAAAAFGTALAGVENYNLIGGSTLTVNAATLGVNVAATNAAASTLTIGGNTVTGTYALAHAADALVATTGAVITGVNAGALTTAEALTLTGTITMTAAQYGDGATTGLTTAAITAVGGADRVNISDVFASAIGARATAVETVALQAAGNDTANVTTGVAGSFVGTLDISAGGTDTITLTNAAHNAETANSMTIAGFTTTAGANMDVIRVVEGGTAISGPLTAIAAGSNTAYAGAVNSVIEVTGGGVVNLLDVANAGTVEVLIGNAIGAVTNAGAYTVIVYGGTANANAGIYSVTFAAADPTAAGANQTVELLGIVTGVGADNLAGINFAI